MTQKNCQLKNERSPRKMREGNVEERAETRLKKLSSRGRVATH